MRGKKIMNNRYAIAGTNHRGQACYYVSGRGITTKHAPEFARYALLRTSPDAPALVRALRDLLHRDKTAKIEKVMGYLSNA